MIFFVLFISFLLKAGTRLYLTRGLNYWESGYSFLFQMAQNFLQAGELYRQGWGLDPVSKFYVLRPPLYPLFIAGIFQMTGGSVSIFIGAQALISTLTVFLVYRLTASIHLPHAAFLAALLAAFYPYNFFHDIQLQETALYNFFSFASVSGLVAAVWKERGSLFLSAGILLGLATLTRASHQIHSLVLLLSVFWVFRKNPKRALKFAGLAVLGFLLCLGPWLARNKRIAGAYTVTSLTGWAFAVANHEFTFLEYPYRGSIDRGIPRFLGQISGEEKIAFGRLRGNEMVQSDWYFQKGWEYITRHKTETLKRGLSKAAVNFLGILSPLHGPLANTAHFVSYWLLTLLALVSLPKVWKTFYFQAFVALSLSQAAVSFVFWAHTSHRSFLDPMLAVLAGVGLSSLLEKKTEPAAI